MGIISSAEPSYSFETHRLTIYNCIYHFAPIGYKNHTFDTSIGFVNSFSKFYGFRRIHGNTYWNPREVKPREAGIPFTMLKKPFACKYCVPEKKINQEKKSADFQKNTGEIP